MVIVADAAPAVGLGHVSRCSAVAAALDVPVRCLAYDAPEPFERDGIRWEPFTGELDADVALIDGYRFENVASMARTVAIFHDGGPVPDVALVIAPIAGGGLTGLEYACLRRVFWDLPPHAGGGGVLVTTGAGAEGDELAERVATVLAATGAAGATRARVTVVRGPASGLRAPAGVAVLDAPADLRDALLAADVVVATAGQTSLEAAACGTPAVLLALDAAQAAQARTLAATGAALLAQSAEDAVERARALLADPTRRQRLSAAGRNAVDGQGARRVARELSRLLGAAA